MSLRNEIFTDTHVRSNGENTYANVTGTNWGNQRGLDVSVLGSQENLITDQATSTTLYVGFSPPGNSSSVSAWKIMRVVTESGNVTVTHASGTNSYDKIWDDRTGYTYS